MSKRAEEAALKEYPSSYSEVNRNAKRIQSYKVDTHKPIRRIYIKGYKQAEKDTIKRAMNVLKKQIDDLFYSRLTIGDFLKQFHKAMEEEQ